MESVLCIFISSNYYFFFSELQQNDHMHISLVLFYIIIILFLFPIFKQGWAPDVFMHHAYYSGRRKAVSSLSFSSNPKQSKEPSAFTLVKAPKAESKGKAT